MPLNIEGLKGDLYTAFTLGEDVNPDSHQNLIDQIEAMAMAIDAYVRSGTVETSVTTSVTTAVAGAVPAATAAPVGTGAGTGSGIGSIT